MGAVKRTFRTLDDTRTLMAVARGQAPPEVLVTGGTVLNVYSGELLPGTVAVAAGRIAYVGDRPFEAGPSTTVVDARGRVVAPGYVDPHGHPHATFTPVELARAVLPRGTTAIVADTLLLLLLTKPELTDEAMTALAPRVRKNSCSGPRNSNPNSAGLGMLSTPCEPPSQGRRKSESTSRRMISPKPRVAMAR